MSVIIKGIEIPTGQRYVDVRVFENGTASIQTGESPFYKLLDVVELPAHHGRLIDADALIRSLEVDPVECPGYPEPEYLGEIIELCREAQTIVEASE